jgi:hypothetical protein
MTTAVELTTKEYKFKYLFINNQPYWLNIQKIISKQKVKL